MVDGRWEVGDATRILIEQLLQIFATWSNTLIIFPPGFQSGWCQKKGNYRIDHFWLWKKEEKSHHHSTFCLMLPLPPLSGRTRPGSFDKRYRTLEWRWCSLVSCAAFTLSHQRGSTRLSFLFWFNLALLSSDFFGRKIFFPPSFPGKKDETVGGWVALRGGGGGSSASWQL